MVSRKGHQRETTVSVIVEYCSDLGRRPVALRPIRPYQIVIHAPILYPLRINPRGVPAGRLRYNAPLPSASKRSRSQAVYGFQFQGSNSVRLAGVQNGIWRKTSVSVSRSTWFPRWADDGQSPGWYPLKVASNDGGTAVRTKEVWVSENPDVR